MSDALGSAIVLALGLLLLLLLGGLLALFAWLIDAVAEAVHPRDGGPP